MIYDVLMALITPLKPAGSKNVGVGPLLQTNLNDERQHKLSVLYVNTGLLAISSV